MSRKYSEVLSKYLTKGEDPKSVHYIAKEFLELMRQKCENCMRYRIECALQPHCEHRKYINILIDMKVKPGDLPAFCYTQHKRNIEKYLKGEVYMVDIIDTKIYLSDFLALLGEKKMVNKSVDRICDAIELKLSRMSEKFYSNLENNQTYIFIYQENLNKIDFETKVVTLNLQNEFLESELELHDVLNLLKSNYDLDSRFSHRNHAETIKSNQFCE